MTAVLSITRCTGPCEAVCGRRPGKISATPAQGGVVRNEQIEPKQPEDTAGKSLGLPQGQVKDEPQRQNQLDRQVRVTGLTAGRRPPWRLPAKYSSLINPQHQVAPSLETGFVFRPISDTIAGLGNAVTVGGIELERHVGEVTARSIPRISGGAPCTNVSRLQSVINFVNGLFLSRFH